MKTYKSQLLTSSRLPAIVGAGAMIVTVTALVSMTPLPTAKANPSALPIQVAQCGAKKCNPCVAKCNPCGPAKCNPCAAAKCNPCNPCGAAKCNPCNPCNPCAAGGAKSACVVPRLAANPCAAAKCNPCNPCAAAKCNPCNPCAAAKGNPCNPCAAAKCNPCNPCGAGGAVEITPVEAIAVYDCLLKELKSAYAGSGLAAAKTYLTWPRYNSAPYVSATHGGRYVNNYADRSAAAYGNFEDAGKMPVGAMLAKDSFSIAGNGSAALGPLFLMEKMAAGFNADSGDWKYTMVMPGGAVFGVTNGNNSAGMTFCHECHIAAADHDSMFFLPEEFRIK